MESPFVFRLPLCLHLLFYFRTGSFARNCTVDRLQNLAWTCRSSVFLFSCPAEALCHGVLRVLPFVLRVIAPYVFDLKCRIIVTSLNCLVSTSEGSFDPRSGPSAWAESEIWLHCGSACFFCRSCNLAEPVCDCVVSFFVAVATLPGRYATAGPLLSQSVHSCNLVGCRM